MGADFTMKVQLGVGNGDLQKEQSILETVAYRGTWGRGVDSYLGMMYERLLIFRDLIAASGSFFLHCDYRVQSMLR